MSSFYLPDVRVHLGLGGRATPQDDPFTGLDWYQRYAERTAGDGVDGRLVSMISFDEPWETWEVHPAGAEVVICTAGRMTLFQEVDGEVRAVELGVGEATVNGPGVWHTADVTEPCTAVFITSGMGTENRPR